MRRWRWERRAARAFLNAMAELGVPVHPGGRCPALDCPCGQLDAQGPVEVVTVAGEVDCYTERRLRDYLRDLAGAGRHLLVLDFGACEYMDSSGLGVIVGAAKAARDGGGKLAIARPQPRVRKVLEITGLVKAWPVGASAAEAVELCRPGIPVPVIPAGPLPEPAVLPDLAGDIAGYLADQLCGQAGQVMLFGDGKVRVLYAEECAGAYPGVGEDDVPLVVRREADGACFEVTVEVRCARVEVTSG